LNWRSGSTSETTTRQEVGRKNRKESARLLEQVRRIGREVASNLQAFVTTILDRRLADWPPLLGMIRPICGDLRKIPDGGSISSQTRSLPLMTVSTTMPDGTTYSG